MGRIGASLSGVERTLLNKLAEADAAATINALRLTTGSKINAPSDNPSGFIALSQFKTELRKVDAAATNVAAAASTASGLQQTVDLIRTQLNLIRSKAVEDEAGALGSQDRAANQAAIDAAVAEINRLAGTQINGRRLLDGSANYSFSGANASQVADLKVFSTGAPTVARQATAATLVYTGVDGLATDAANITIKGTAASATIDVAADESLSDVARRINAFSADTGVVASASGDELTLQTKARSSRARLSVAVNSGDFDVSGGSGAGTASGTDPVLAAAPTIAGRVIAAATNAQLVYTGSSGQIDSGAATFTLTGKRGETEITVSNGEDLADVAERVNLDSHRTGIVASVDGDSLVFESVDYGAKSTAQIAASSGTFAVTGGDGAGADAGTDAVVEINGEVIRGSTAAQAAELTHYEATGQIAYDTTFALTGNLGTALISFNQSDTLANAAQAINDEAVNTGVSASVSLDGKTLTLASQTIGANARIETIVASGSFALDGGNGDGSANGVDANKIAQVDGNRVSFNRNGLRFSLELATGFVGELDSISITNGGSLAFALTPDVRAIARLALPSLSASRLGGLSGTLDQLATGGSASGLDGFASQAIRIVDEALGDLEIAAGLADGFADSTVASSASLIESFRTNLENSIDAIDKVDSTEEALLQSKNQALISNALSALSILDQQRTSVVALLKQIAGLS